VALTTAKAFDGLHDNLLLTDPQVATIKGRRDSVKEYLQEYFRPDSDMPLLRATLIGSAARKTIIRPIEDVDVLAVFDYRPVWDRYKGDSRAFLYRITNALRKYQVKVVGARGQAVRLFYQQAPHADITPVFEANPSGFVLPSGDGGWIRTDPDVNDEFLKRRNSELGGKLKRFSRMLKQWNRTHSNHLIGFHLEVMAQSSF
jgi:SMODS domain-containing protein